jgi:hypothetical protein
MEAPSDDYLVTRLLQIFNQKKEDGSYRYRLEEVKDALAVFLLELGPEVPDEALPEEFRQVLGAFSAKIGFAGGADLKERLDTYFAAHPLNPELVQQMAALRP